MVDGVDIAEVNSIAHACALARDMVNTPANDLGPLQLETIAREIYGADGVDYRPEADAQLEDYARLGYAQYCLVARSLASPGILSAWFAKRHFQDA